MRITGGAASGVRLESPGKGVEIRPATDRMREAVFSSLGPLVEHASVLDLFAGTGAYGLEALSRGAESITWVENNRKVIPFLKRNLEATRKSLGETGTDATTRILPHDFRKIHLTEDESFGLIFADPPYRSAESLTPAILDLATGLLEKSAAARLVLEIPGDQLLPCDRWTELRRFGKSRSGPSVRVLTPLDAPES